MGSLKLNKTLIKKQTLRHGPARVQSLVAIETDSSGICVFFFFFFYTAKEIPREAGALWNSHKNTSI